MKKIIYLLLAVSLCCGMWSCDGLLEDGNDGTEQPGTDNSDDPNKPSIVVSTDKVSLTSAAQSFTVEVSHNIDITYEISKEAQSWLTRTETRAMTSDTYVFQVTDNMASQPRSATITFTNKANGVSESVEVTQATGGFQPTLYDPVFLTYLLDNFDRNNDGEISKEEAYVVTEIFLSSSKYNKARSLQGIEYFPNLRKLQCYNTDITDIDVSQNTQLESLECYSSKVTRLNVSGCTALTTLSCYSNQLTSLDVSQNTALTTLSCYSNQLTRLDVSQNTALTDLRCYKNQLTSLDVSQNTALTTLNCNSNQLTSLDASKNTALTNLVCSYNQLTDLDVSKNTALTHLNCRGNELTSLDVSGCANLSTIFWYGNQFEYINMGDANPTRCYYSSFEDESYPYFDDGFLGSSTKLKVVSSKITQLEVRGNNLQSLDVSECPALTSLSCNSNQLTSLNISGCTALTKVECHNNQLTSLNANGCTALTYLDCSYNQLTSLDLTRCVLRTLDCSNNQLTSLDVSGCTALKELDCYFNPLEVLNLGDVEPVEYDNNPNTHNFYPDFDGRLSSSTKLKVISSKIYLLTVINNNLQSLDVSECPALDRLFCHSNQLTSLNVGGCTALCELYCYSNQLTDLDVSKNKMLSILECYNNRLTSLDMPIYGSDWLSTLDCSNNQLTSLNVSGCRALKTLSYDFNPLEVLNLGDYYATSKDLCDGRLSSSTKLKVISSKIEKLSVYNNNLQSLDVSECPALTYLSCHSNQLTSLNVSGCTALYELYCSSNQLTDLDVSQNKKLTYLSCHSNQLTSLDLSGCTALYKLYCYSNQLTSLDLSGCPALYDLYCAPMETLQTLTLKAGCSIFGITYNRSTNHIPKQTIIKYVK